MGSFGVNPIGRKQLIDDLLPEYKAVFGGDSLEELVDDD